MLGRSLLLCLHNNHNETGPSSLSCAQRKRSAGRERRGAERGERGRWRVVVWSAVCAAAASTGRRVAIFAGVIFGELSKHCINNDLCSAKDSTFHVGKCAYIMVLTEKQKTELYASIPPVATYFPL